MVFDLMFSLGATEDQLDFPVVYGSAKIGWMGEDWSKPTDNINFLLDKIIEVIPAPHVLEGTPQMLITSLDYSNYTGRIAVGRIHRGCLTEGMNVTVAHRDGTMEKTRIKEIHSFEGMGHSKTDKVECGDLCAIVGLEQFEIGDTICDVENPEPLPPIKIDEPTMSMLFTINNSPFFGKEGKYCTSRQIEERLQKELQKNLALQVTKTDGFDSWVVYGRGVLHLDGCLGLFIHDDALVKALGVQAGGGAPGFDVDTVPVELLLPVGVKPQNDQGKDADDDSSDSVFHAVLPCLLRHRGIANDTII